MSEIFKITGVGIDTSEINKFLNTGDLENFRYIHTSPVIGNEVYIKSALQDSHILITTVDSIDYLETIIPRHLSELGRDKIDLLMIDSKCKIEDNIDTLNNLIISGQIEEVGISNPESLQRLIDLRNRISQLSHVSLEICPLNFDWEIIKYCQNNNIRILGFNPFGGRINYPRLIEGFSVPYLLSFSAVYSDVVFLSGKRQDILEFEVDYLLDLINREYPKEFKMTSDVHKLPKDPKKIIYTSLKISDACIIPYSSAEQIFSYPEILFKFSQQPPTADNSGEDKLASMVSELAENIDTPTPTLIRYRILDLARLEYPEIDGWRIFSTPLDTQAFIISGVRKIQTKKFLRTTETTEQINYIAYYDGKNLTFVNLKNALQTT